jgi:transcriptional/translational regulatory protein YebC/TACO1
MTHGKLVAFRVYKNNIKAGKGKTVLNKFVQKFYGQTVSSHGGKYRHHIQGLLEDVTHIKLVRSVIIVKESDLEKVLQFLEKYDAEVYTRDIILTPEDEKTLNKETQ